MDQLNLDQLTLDEKCRLLGGASTWRTHAVEHAGIPQLKLSDGPNGVRGEAFGHSGSPGVVVPVGIALGSTWDPELLGEIGELLGREARRKAAHVLLGPTVNLQRTPVGGRVFECYSEDPELTARLAVAFVRGVQAQGVGVTVKHFVGNDTEIERMTVDAQIPEAALRELYLRPFEACVREAEAWGIMSAYNRLDGEFCAENRRLLQSILRDEWGFDGVVVSDWGGAHDTVGAGQGGLNLAMPGPTTVFGEPLADAVRRGAVDEVEVDARVAELGLLISRTRAAERSADAPEQSVDDPAERDLCRRAAVGSLVLLRNVDAALPLTPTQRVAVVGPNAATTRIMGGGSSSLEPLPSQSILEALTDRLGPALVAHAPGVSIEKLTPRLTAEQLRTPDGEPGLLVEFRNGRELAGDPVATEVIRTSMFRSFGSAPPGVDLEGQFWVTMVGSFVPSQDGPHRVGAVVAGKGHVTVGDTVLLDDPERKLPRGDWLFGYGCEEQTAVISCSAGVPVPIRVSTSGVKGFSAVTFGAQPVDETPLLEKALAAVADVDVAVVVVGTNDEWETEGNDRDTIALPGEQDKLIRRVAAAARRTVVVVNAGSPVAMPWVDEVDAVLVASFAGIETGPAVAAVLAGDADPGGRLPISYPRRLEDCPAWSQYRPVDGVQAYGEGRLMGYRGHDASGVEPLFPFGHGLSYGTSEWSDARLSSGDPFEVSVSVAATGDRPVTDVVQVYVSHPDPDMPPKSLVAWGRVVVEPGSSTTVSIPVPREALRRWDSVSGGWVVDPGPYEVLVAASAGDVRYRLPLTVG